MSSNDADHGKYNEGLPRVHESQSDDINQSTVAASDDEKHHGAPETTRDDGALTSDSEKDASRLTDEEVGYLSQEVAPSHSHGASGPYETDEECQPARTRSPAGENLSYLGSRMSTDTEGNTYPEGGFEAYSVVFGCFCSLFGSLGLVNSIGSFQAWVSQHQLAGHSQAAIGWLFGMYSFLLFFGGLQIGPVFDAKGPKWLLLAGSILTLTSMIILGFCHTYWHFMVVYSVMGGIGCSLVFTPAMASCGHFFFRRRGRATGLVSTGGSLGGIVFPLMLQKLLPQIGFAWATRAVALICLVMLSIGCLLVHSRLPKKKATKENILPDFRIFAEPLFALTCAGIFFIEFGMFVPIAYISSYALDHGINQALAYQLLAILNVGSFFGRWIPGFIADYTGRFNTMIATILLSLVSTACFWLLAGDSIAMIVLFALLFGFSSGSNISLTPVCVGQACKTEHYGRYYATTYSVVSFGYVASLVHTFSLCLPLLLHNNIFVKANMSFFLFRCRTLTGTPIGGSILTLNGGDYWGLITFTSCCYFVGLVCFVAAKVYRHGWNPFIVF